MSKIFNAARILVAGIFLCGTILISANAKAADFETMRLFRETVEATAGNFDGVFHQDVYFVVPSFVGELDFIASLANQRINMAGDFGFWMTSQDGTPVEYEVPFYIAQDADKITLYFETDKKWKKMTAPIKADQVAEIFKDNSQLIEEQISIVKDVTLLKDTDSQRMFLVTIDGAKLAEKFKANLPQVSLDVNVDAEADANNADGAAAVRDMQNKFLEYIDTGLRNANIWYTWSVNKTNWQTINVSANLAGAVQSVAQAALDDPEAQIPEPLREIVETLAYFSEFKAYTSYLNDEAKSRLEVPKKVLKAKEVESFSDSTDKKKK